MLNDHESAPVSTAAGYLGRCLSTYRDLRSSPDEPTSEAGVTAIEYALIGALIAVVIISAVAFAGQELLALYQLVADWLGWVVDRTVRGATGPPPGS